MDKKLKSLLDNNSYATDISEYLLKIRKKDKDAFYKLLDKIPDEILGEVLLELPEKIRDKAYKYLPIERLSEAVEELETDDATDVIKDIEDIDKKKAEAVLDNLDEDDKEEIEWLKKYDDDEAGAYMQTELFSATLDENINEAIKRLKKLKLDKELENIHQVFIVDDKNSLVATIPLEDLITYDFNLKFKDIIKNNEENFKPISVNANTNIQEVINLFDDYNLNVIAVIGYKDRLIGRITSDDILEVANKNATEQIYQLAGVDDEAEHEEDIINTTKNRGLWLFINLITAILASAVIGLFDDTISQYVALAVLMPIVASMGGNAGSQTLAVMVRQLALGEIDDENQKEALKKEIKISLLNGFAFAIVMGIIAFVWFNNLILGFVIALSMVITLLCAGLFGSLIPLMLKKLDIDPAIGSSVLLTTVTDVMGFFSFLGLAKLFLLN